MANILARLLHRFADSIELWLKSGSEYPEPGIDFCDCRGIVGDCGKCDNSCRENGIR